MIKIAPDYTVSPTVFPDNTSQIWKLPKSLFDHKHLSIIWDFTHEGEIVQLAQLKALLDASGITSDLHLSYLPYGRQDKEVSNTSTFALTVFAEMLNALQFDRVTITDPHSNEALRLISHSDAQYPLRTIQQVFEMTNSDVVCYPDKGALKKGVIYFTPVSPFFGSAVARFLGFFFFSFGRYFRTISAILSNTIGTSFSSLMRLAPYRSNACRLRPR